MMAVARNFLSSKSQFSRNIPANTKTNANGRMKKAKNQNGLILF